MFPGVFGRVVQRIFSQAGYCPNAFIGKAFADFGLQVGLSAPAFSINL